jgi:hypothetical protein
MGKDEGHAFATKVNQEYFRAVEVLFPGRYLIGEKAH